MKQNLINHIVFVIDESSSMSHNTADVVSVFDGQIKYLSQRSQELNQETRASVYTFANQVECLVYDTDVMRLPSIKGDYRPNGMTALLDGVGQAITDLQHTATLYGDHAFLIYVLTDGMENVSRKYNSLRLKTLLESLPENWTLAVLVPDQNGVFEAKKVGFSANNISIWDTSNKKGVVEVGEKIRATVDNYLVGRSKGVRGTSNLFQMNTNISTTEVKRKLAVVPASEYMVIPIRSDGPIKETFEYWTKQPYRTGSGYYQLTKKEKIQANKHIMIKNTRDGKVYSGDAARQMLGLPDHEVRVEPTALKGYDIFVQSNSTNRKLIAGTELIVLV